MGYMLDNNLGYKWLLLSFGLPLIIIVSHQRQCYHFIIFMKDLHKRVCMGYMLDNNLGYKWLLLSFGLPLIIIVSWSYVKKKYKLNVTNFLYF